MKKNQSSKTAMGIAFIRAMESSKPKEEQICYDPFARSFINDVTYTLSKLFVNTGLYDRIAKGVVGFIIARERYIDDYLITCLQQGFNQIVILGAGFDTRAYRINGIDKTKVFEVDHPATQMVKLEKLQKIIAPLPDHVTFVPVDFHTQDLREQLFRYGYSQERKTLFIWQGVTVYLNAEAVDSTLSFIAQNATSGSTVIFDYYYNETLQDTSRTDVKNMHRTARITGENYLFGIGEGELEAFLTDRGFQDVHCAKSNTLKNQYFTGVNATRTIISGIAIASAQVR